MGSSPTVLQVPAVVRYCCTCCCSSCCSKRCSDCCSKCCSSCSVSRRSCASTATNNNNAVDHCSTNSSTYCDRNQNKSGSTCASDELKSPRSYLQNQSNSSLVENQLTISVPANFSFDGERPYGDSPPMAAVGSRLQSTWNLCLGKSAVRKRGTRGVQGPDDAICFPHPVDHAFSEWRVQSSSHKIASIEDGAASSVDAHGAATVPVTSQGVSGVCSHANDPIGPRVTTLVGSQMTVSINTSGKTPLGSQKHKHGHFQVGGCGSVPLILETGVTGSRKGVVTARAQKPVPTATQEAAQVKQVLQRVMPILNTEVFLVDRKGSVSSMRAQSAVKLQSQLEMGAQDEPGVGAQGESDPGDPKRAGPVSEREKNLDGIMMPQLEERKYTSRNRNRLKGWLTTRRNTQTKSNDVIKASCNDNKMMSSEDNIAASQHNVVTSRDHLHDGSCDQVNISSRDKEDTTKGEVIQVNGSQNETRRDTDRVNQSDERPEANTNREKDVGTAADMKADELSRNRNNDLSFVTRNAAMLTSFRRAAPPRRTRRRTSTSVRPLDINRLGQDSAILNHATDVKNMADENVVCSTAARSRCPTRHHSALERYSGNSSEIGRERLRNWVYNSSVLTRSGSRCLALVEELQNPDTNLFPHGKDCLTDGQGWKENIGDVKPEAENGAGHVISTRVWKHRRYSISTGTSWKRTKEETVEKTAEVVNKASKGGLPENGTHTIIGYDIKKLSASRPSERTENILRRCSEERNANVSAVIGSGKSIDAKTIAITDLASDRYSNIRRVTDAPIEITTERNADTFANRAKDFNDLEILSRNNNSAVTDWLKGSTNQRGLSTNSRLRHSLLDRRFRQNVGGIVDDKHDIVGDTVNDFKYGNDNANRSLESSADVIANKTKSSGSPKPRVYNIPHCGDDFGNHVTPAQHHVTSGSNDVITTKSGVQGLKVIPGETPRTCLSGRSGIIRYSSVSELVAHIDGLAYRPSGGLDCYGVRRSLSTSGELNETNSNVLSSCGRRVATTRRRASQLLALAEAKANSTCS